MKMISLYDLVTFQRGFDLPEKDRADGNVPVIASRAKVGFHNEAKVSPPGVVIGRSGSVGGGQYIDVGFWPLNTTLWIKDFKENHPRYIYYLCRSINFNSLNAGTGVPTLNRNHLSAIRVQAKSLHEQFAIAETLSNYDNLIENNRRRIALLEKSARILYREWFVHFRFPYFDEIPIADRDPKNWKAVPFSQLGEFLNGFAFKPHHLGDEGLPIVKIPELKNGVTNKTSYNLGVEVPEKYHLIDGDLLFSWSGTLSVNLWAGGPALLNQHLFKVSPNGKVSKAFLMTALQESMPQFLNETTGATMIHIRRSALDKVCVLVPPKLLLRQFEELATKSYEQLLILYRQINYLQRARDLLLPRLMDGRIKI